MQGERMTDWRAAELGRPELVEVGGARLRCFQAGQGPVLVFVHGVLANANLWRKVVAQLSGEFRCVALDLPLGSHAHPMGPAADLTPPGLADLIADAIAALGLEQVTLVGNDTGGALCQIVATRRPERLAGLVLTSCDYGDNFPPRGFRVLRTAARGGWLGPVLAPTRF